MKFDKGTKAPFRTSKEQFKNLQGELNERHKLLGLNDFEYTICSVFSRFAVRQSKGVGAKEDKGVK